MGSRWVSAGSDHESAAPSPGRYNCSVWPILRRGDSSENRRVTSFCASNYTGFLWPLFHLPKPSAVVRVNVFHPYIRASFRSFDLSHSSRGAKSPPFIPIDLQPSCALQDANSIFCPLRQGECPCIQGRPGRCDRHADRDGNDCLLPP